MRSSRRSRLGEAGAAAFLSARASGRRTARAPEELRRVLRPSNLLLGGVLLAGWLALVGWTGAGPEGWQARLCADLDLRPRSCSAVQPVGAAGRAQS